MGRNALALFAGSLSQGAVSQPFNQFNQQGQNGGYGQYGQQQPNQNQNQMYPPHNSQYAHDSHGQSQGPFPSGVGGYGGQQGPNYNNARPQNMSSGGGGGMGTPPGYNPDTGYPSNRIGTVCPMPGKICGDGGDNGPACWSANMDPQWKLANNMQSCCKMTFSQQDSQVRVNYIMDPDTSYTWCYATNKVNDGSGGITTNKVPKTKEGVSILMSKPCCFWDYYPDKDYMHHGRNYQVTKGQTTSITGNQADQFGLAAGDEFPPYTGPANGGGGNYGNRQGNFANTNQRYNPQGMQNYPGDFYVTPPAQQGPMQMQGNIAQARSHRQQKHKHRTLQQVAPLPSDTWQQQVDTNGDFDTNESPEFVSADTLKRHFAAAPGLVAFIQKSEILQEAAKEGASRPRIDDEEDEEQIIEPAPKKHRRHKEQSDVNQDPSAQGTQAYYGGKPPKGQGQPQNQPVMSQPQNSQNQPMMSANVNSHNAAGQPHVTLDASCKGMSFSKKPGAIAACSSASTPAKYCTPSATNPKAALCVDLSQGLKSDPDDDFTSDDGSVGKGSCCGAKDPKQVSCRVFCLAENNNASSYHFTYAVYAWNSEYVRQQNDMIRSDPLGSGLNGHRSQQFMQAPDFSGQGFSFLETDATEIDMEVELNTAAQLNSQNPNQQVPAVMPSSISTQKGVNYWSQSCCAYMLKLGSAKAGSQMAKTNNYCRADGGGCENGSTRLSGLFAMLLPLFFFFRR